MPISWNTVNFKFRWIFETDERRIVSGQTFHNGVLRKPIDPWQQMKHGSMGCHRTTYGRFVPTQFFSHRSPKSSEIWKWLISRSGPSFKITQPNLMILVSFSSAEDALANDVKRYDIFSSQGTENLLFRFFWDTRYRPGFYFMRQTQETKLWEAYQTSPTPNGFSCC